LFVAPAALQIFGSMRGTEFFNGILDLRTLRGHALADDSGRAIFPETGTVLRHPHRRHEGKSDVKTKD
jgi:hypothetical protein